MSEALKPCPFCESSEVEINHIVSFKGDVNHYFGSCKKCRTNMGCFKTEEEAIKAWNTRPNQWHTGTPTEEGWYLLKVMHEDEIVYYANLLENNTDLQWRYAMYGKIIAYKEIKP